MGFENDLQQVKQHYRPINKPRVDKRYYCGVNIDCSSRQNSFDGKQGIHMKKY